MKRARTKSGKTILWLAVGWWAGVAGIVGAEEVDVSELPPPYAGKVDFQKDVLPIFENTCFRCHGPERPKSGFRLDNRQSALAGGDYGVAILPGHSADSPLIHYVARLVEDMEMPPTGKGDPLRPYEIGILRAWIDQGVDYGGRDAPERARLSFELTTGAGYLDVDGDAGRFRQNSRQTDGWSGGVSEFSARGPLGEQTDLRLDGRVLFGEDDARLRFEVRRKDWGSVSGGVETGRTWYDDSGGRHTAFTPPLFELGRDLHVDTGRAWIDLELDRGELPWMRLGYEFQFREGTKSLTQWGNVSPPIRGIYPAIKDVDEETHILKFDVAKEFHGWQLENNLRVEWHDQEQRRRLATAFNSAKPGPEKFTDVRETHQHTHGANAFTVEKWFREWFMIGGGYLYSWLDGGATFDQSSQLTANAALPPSIGFTGFGLFADRFFNSTSILLEQQSHVGSLSTKLGPWQELLLYGGVQGDWTEQNGFAAVNQRFGSPTAAVFPVSSWSELDRRAFEERAGLRFTGLPWSSIYAEGRWQQEEVGQFEDEEFGGFPTLVRGTDASADARQYRFGFSSSPWQSLLFAGHYQLLAKEDDYRPAAGDNSPGPQGFGYPNFIGSRSLDGERPALKTSDSCRPASSVPAGVPLNSARCPVS